MKRFVVAGPDGCWADSQRKQWPIMSDTCKGWTSSFHLYKSSSRFITVEFGVLHFYCFSFLLLASWPKLLESAEPYVINGLIYRLDVCWEIHLHFIGTRVMSSNWNLKMNASANDSENGKLMLVHTSCTTIFLNDSLEFGYFSTIYKLFFVARF